MIKENEYLRNELDKKTKQLIIEINQKKEESQKGGLKEIFGKVEKDDLKNRINLLKSENKELLQSVEETEEKFEVTNKHLNDKTFEQEQLLHEM